MQRTLAIAAVLAIALAACKGEKDAAKAAAGKVILEDHFDGKALAGHWKDTSRGKYTIVDGWLKAQGAHNRPLWLKTRLPDDVRIDFKARSMSEALDIKVEVFGDGASYAKKASYTATSYVLILGGWNNTRSIIARMNEHGDDRKERLKPRGEVGREYSFAITRKGGRIAWELDGDSFLSFEDANPLKGPGHEHFAINNWESEVYFDDLVIREL